MAALKKVDFPVFGFPTTPSSREYEGGMLCFLLSLVLLFVLGFGECFCFFWALSICFLEIWQFCRFVMGNWFFRLVPDLSGAVF